MALKLIDSQDRGRLSEGRNYGMAYAFCKRTDDVIETIQPLSPCKDFLNDVVWSEATGKNYEAYGLKTTKLGIFDGGVAHLLMGVVPYKYGGGTESYERWLAAMGNLEAIASFMAHFEGAVGVPVSTWHQMGDNRILAVLPRFWVEAIYRISLWTLLVRNALEYKEGDKLEFLKKQNNGDAYMLKAAIPKLERMMAGDNPPQDMNAITRPHNLGIVSFSFPTKIN